MVATAGNSSATMKSPASGSRALLPTVVNSKKRKSPNITEKFLQSDPLLRRLSSAAASTGSFLETNDLFLPPHHFLLLESLLSSLPIPPPPPSHSTPPATWFHRFVNSAAENDDPRWHLCFRMSKPNFFKLLSILSSDSDPLPSSSLAAAIFRLAHNASYRSIAQRFGFDSVSDASRAFFTVCKLVHERLGKLDDPQPDYSPRSLPNCCGALGFERFDVDGELLDSLIVQAVVDSSGRFADISAGWPGTMRPEAILRQTKLFSIAEESRSFLNGGDPCRLGNGGVSVPRYVLGGSSLPLLTWLATPYYNSSNEEGEEGSFEFDDVARAALRTVRVAFGKVRARWRILDRRWRPEMIEFLPFVVTTGCLLHNFLVDSGDGDLEEECVVVVARDGSEMMRDEEFEDTRRCEGEADIGASRIRDAIAENLSRVISSKK